MFGTYSFGTAVLGGTAGGASIKACAFDLIVVDRKSVSTAFDVIILVNSTKQASFDLIVAASGLKVFGFDMIISEKQRNNLPAYQAVGNNLSMPVDPNRLAVWSTNNRPASPILYQSGINTQTNKLEWFDGTNWRDSQGTIQ